MEGFDRLENSHPEAVTDRVNEIADILNRAGGFRFFIDSRNLNSVIVLEEGELSADVIKEIIFLTQADATTSTTLDGSTNEITVSLNSLN